MLISDFSARAEECLQLSKRAGSPHDRELFLEMARAWYGLNDEEPAAPPATKH
jgi:hypothetical protein